MVIALFSAVNDPTPSPSTPPTSTASGPADSSPELSQTEMDEAAYLATVEVFSPSSSAFSSDRELVAMGREICSLMDRMTLQEMTVWAASNDLDPDLLGALGGATISTFCPRHAGYFG